MEIKLFCEVLNEFVCRMQLCMYVLYFMKSLDNMIFLMLYVLYIYLSYCCNHLGNLMCWNQVCLLYMWQIFCRNSFLIWKRKLCLSFICSVFIALKPRREHWQALVIQLLGGRFCWMAWRGDSCWSLVHVDPASALRLASTWTSPGSRRGSGWLRRGALGQGGHSAAKSPRVGQ